MAKLAVKNESTKIQVIFHSRYGTMRRPPNKKMFYRCEPGTMFPPEERENWQIIEFYIVPKEFLQVKMTERGKNKRCSECHGTFPATEMDSTGLCRGCLCAEYEPLRIDNVIPIGGHYGGYEVHR